MGLSRRTAMVAMAGAGLSACDRRGANILAPPERPVGYAAAPTVLEARRDDAGRVTLTGQAEPDGRVRLRAPEGDRIEAAVSDDGRWAAVLPGADRPRLFAFEAEIAGRVIRGEGALAILPAPAVGALVLRAGYGGEPAPAGRPDRLRLVSVDFDGAGFAAAGLAPPATPVRLSVDGAVLSVGQADRRGRFALVAVDPRRRVGVGLRRVRLETVDGAAVEREVEVTVPTLAADRAYGSDPAPGGWTVIWRLPGGGLQASRLFADAFGAPAAAGAGVRA